MSFGPMILAAAAQAAAAAQGAGARQPHEVVMPSSTANREFLERYGFSEAVIDGDRVYLSGVVAGAPPGQDESAAYDRAFRMIGGILERAGSSWDGVLDITTYHTDLPAQIEAFSAVKHRYVRAPFPTWTAIDVDRLLPANGLVEIKVLARRASAPPGTK